MDAIGHFLLCLVPSILLRISSQKVPFPASAKRLKRSFVSIAPRVWFESDLSWLKESLSNLIYRKEMSKKFPLIVRVLI